MKKQLNLIWFTIVVIPLLLVLNNGCGGGGGGGGGGDVIIDDGGGAPNMVTPANATVADGWIANIYNNSQAQLVISNVSMAADSNGIMHLALEAAQKEGGLIADSDMAYANFPNENKLK